jgi:hypothetical protein
MIRSILWGILLSVVLLIGMKLVVDHANATYTPYHTPPPQR